jgi:hypothetical protein
MSPTPSTAPTTSEDVAPLSPIHTTAPSLPPQPSTRYPNIDLQNVKAINAVAVELDVSPPHTSAQSTEKINTGGIGGSSVDPVEQAAVKEKRSKDPGVIVDVPKEPTAEEVQAVRRAEGMRT